MSTDQRVSSLSTPIDAPIISADYDIQLLNNEGQLETAAIDYAQTGHENETVFKDLWDAIIQLLNAGQLNDDNDLLLSLIDQLMTTGVLPSEENFDQDALIQFHQWFIGMDANATYSDLMTLLEGKLLSTYANALPNSPMQQVIVFDSINEFNQYASYCQVVLPNDVITLSVFSAIPEPYDSSLHHSFGLMYHGDWRDSLLESNGVDYETAHTIFEFTELDLAAIDEWLTSLFPYGFSEVSDDEILLTLMSALQSDGFTYQVDIADQWQSMVEFLASKSGDCEEFSHLLFSAVQRIYDQLPDRDRPTLQVVSGLVGTGLNAFGHSLVMLEKNGAFFVLDPTGSKITSIDDLLLFSVFEEQINFQEYLRYALGETTIAVQLDELANFSTSSNYNDTLNEQFQAVFGSQDDFSSVISEEDKEYNLDSYDKLVKKIIALEMQRLIESGQTSGIFAIGMNELSAFLVMDYTEPLDRDELAFLQSSQTRSDINAVIEFCAQNIMPVTEDQFDFLESSQRAALVAALKEQGVITNSEYLDYSKDYGIKKTTLWNQLIDLGIITNIGMIDRDVLYNDTVIDQLQQWFQDKGGADGQQKGQLLIDLLHSRVAVFSSETAKSSDDLFENTLMQFDSLTEELLVGLTAPATPIYANPEINSNYTMISPYVIGGYNQSRNDNSLFIRVDHQKLQQSMSRFFALQNTISAYMTMIFSISDMVSSIAAKLGDDNATSASTAKQRQKIIQAFNSYSSGVNESIGTLTDIFDKTVEKTNESRYQTGLAQIDAEFADLSLQLANEFTANEYEIRSEKLKSELSQDYYNMMHDNRLSMQQAMVDVPHFGPNVMPSQFSHLFISNDDESYGDLDSMQLWAALFAHQVIDQYGQINSSVNLDDLDIMSMNYTTFNSVFQALPETSDDDKHMKQFLFDQFRFFEANRNSLGETQQSQLNAAIFDQLKRHQQSINHGFRLIDPATFDTSRFLFAYMNLMERSFDSKYKVDFDREVNFLNPNIDRTHNLYGVGQIGLEDVSIYMAKSYPFPIDHVVFSLYSAEINDVLIHSQIHLSNLTASDFSHIKDANGNAIDTTELLPYLVDKSYLVDRDTFYRVSFNDWQETIVSEDQIISALNKAGLINLENQIDVDALRDLDGVPNEIKELYRDIPDSDFIMDALMTDLNLRANPNALHLTQAASNQEELGAGFQMVNTSMVSMARKNFMLMNMTRRVYMTLVCSYTQFFEKIAGKLSKDSTQSSHYGDWQNSLLESHMGIAERQLSSIHNDTVSMVSRINELHKHRLNLVKLSDPLLRGLDMTSTWSSVVGALLMLMPTPITHMLGILITMASSILSLAESWRGYQLEMELDQEMTEQFSMYDLKASVETFFNANLRVSSDASFTTNAGESIDPQLAPRSVVDYNNAHLYINPDDPQVQELLRNDVFPNGIPSDTTQIIEDIHSFMSRETQYIADSGADDWACVGEVAQRKSGDCEDLVNLEHSLILAAFQSLDDPALNIANHAAYVTVDDVSLGHVYMTVDVDGETMVLDPSLSAGTLVPYEAYQATYNVKDVFTYDHTQTNVLNPKALGLETAGLGDVFNDVGSWFSDLFDDVIPDDFFNLFLPDFSDASIFDNMFNYDPDASNEAIISKNIGDVVDLMLGAFGKNIQAGDGSFIGETFGWVGQGVASGFNELLRPLIMSFVPGSAGYDISSGMMDLFGDFSNEILGDLFKPDRQKILNLLQNRHQGSRHSMGIQPDSVDDMLNDISQEMNSDIGDINLENLSHYFFRLTIDSQFIPYQNDIDLFLQNQGLYDEISPADFTFLTTIEDQNALFEELKSYEYIIWNDNFSRWVVNYDFDLPEGNFFFTLPYASDFRSYQAEVDGFLQSMGLYDDISPESFTFLDSPNEQTSLFNELKQLNYISYNTNLDRWTVNYGFSTSAGVQSETGFADAQPMVGFNASAGIAPLTASTKAQLRLDYSETLNSLMRLYDSELMGRGDGYFSQDNRRGNAFSDIFMTPDLLSKRVVLNQYKLAEGKDQIRIIQEKLRFIFTITKIISDAFATIAAQLGDENKIKTAAGLQKLFETSFGLVSVDVQLQDYLFSHYETAVSHNFDVRKIRYERRVDSSFKTANILAVLMGPAFGKLFETSISIFQTLSIYFDYWGSNDFTDHYLKENFFDSDGFLQSKGAMRYEQSTLDQNRRYQLASQNNMGFGQARVSVDALAYYRQYSFDLMLEATKIQPLRTGLKLSLIKNENGNLYYQQSVNYNAFNDIREKIVAHGMNAQKNLMMLMSMTGYLSSLAKSLRGDGKVGGQHLSSLVDVMEREISHDLDELGRIQSFQEQVVSLNNQKFDSLKRVERTYYEMIFFAFFFGARLVSSSMFTVFDIIMVKAFANMFQGVMLSFINYDEKRLSNELEEINDVSANQKNINAVGYGQGQPREINYSGIGNYESNYLDFSSDSSNMILSSGYGNDAVTNFLGLGFKSNNWFEQAHQNMMLKKLFAQWNLILKSGQSVAEAYQSIADELGAVTSSMGYSSALRTQMNIQKSLMTKNLDNRFSLAGQVVNVFNSIQSERFESMMQGIKYVVSKAAGSAYNKQQASRRERFADSGQGSFKKGVDLTQYTFVEFLEEMFRTITGAVRRTHLEGQRRDLISDAEQSYTKNYQSGSYSESMLYMSNIKKAKQKVNADIIGKVKSFDGFFKTVILNLKDTWQNKVQEQSRKDLGFDRISQQGDKLAKSLILNDSQKAQDALRYFSSLMSKSSTSSRPSYLYNLGRSVISVFSRQMERDLQSEKSAKQSLSVWSSIERLHKQMLRYGGSEDALAGQFGSEMNMLNKSINDLDTLNQNSIPKPISINQLSLVESISASVNRLLSIANEFDNERQEQNKLWQFYRTMRNPHIRPLSQLALNIDHFATYASVGMAINLNQHVKNKTIENKQDMLKVMQWIKARAEKDPQRRVYRDLGEYFTQLSYHAEDERHKTIVGFLENTLKGAPEHRDEAQQMLHDFSKRVLAAKTKGAKHTFKLLNRLGVPAHTFFNGHDGIIDIANYELKNYKAAKRWLFAKDESVKDHLSKTILTQGQSKVYAKSLLACAHADPDGWPDKGRFGEGYFSSFVFAKSVPRYVGLGRQYSNRLKRIVDDAMAAINEGSIKEQKDKILAAFDFGLELTKGNLKIDSILASDYVFEQLSEAVRKNADLEFQFDDIKDHLPRLQWGGVDGNPAHKVFGEVLINGGQKDINESYSTSALSFDSIEKVESFHVKRAINWASENKKESIWFNALFNAHPTEVIRFLSQLKPDDLKPYFELFKNVSVENPTQAFQFKLLGFDQLTPPTNDTEAIEWVQIIWPAHEVNKMQPTDLEDPFLKRFQDELALGLASDQVANILKTVPGKLIQALFDYDKVRKSQFSNVTGQNDVPQDLGEEMVGQSMDHDTPTLANGDFSAAPDLIPIVGQYSQAAPHQSEDNSNNPLSLFLHKVKNNDSNMLSFIKQAMIFQPDLAIHLIHDRKQFLDINSFAVDLATLTAWAMDVPKICDIFDCFNEDSKHKFLRQILVQSDCAAELFFHLKPNAFDWMDGFSQDEIDKALFFKCEFSQSAYDELSPAQRQDCIYNKRSDIETNISDCIDALNENDKIVFLKELIQKESTQLYQNANGLPSKILSNSVSEQISTANELLFFYETLKPILDDFERKRVNELDAVFKSLDECVRQDKFFGGANALVIQLEMKAFLSKHRDRFFSHIKDNPGDLDLLKNVMNLYQTYSPKDLIWMQEHADGSDYPDTIKAYVKKYQITQRVNALVADSILREKFHYRPVSEISTQFSMIPERYQLDVYTSILDQFNLFASQDQLASISRMLDVVYGLVPYILQNSDSSTKDNYQSCTLKFLKQVVTSGIELNAPQKQGLIFLIHSMETSKEKFLDFNRLEHQVGIDVIIKYYFNEEKMYQRINSDFLKGLKSRIDLSLASPVVKQNPDFNDLWNSFEQSRYEFRAIAIDQIKRDQAKPIVKEILKASNDKAVEMLNEFYEIAKNEFNQAELQRIILEDIKVKFKANTFKELLLTNDFMTFFKDLSKLFKNDFFDGLQRGYVYDQRSTIKSVIDTKAPSKSIVGGYGKMLGAPELKFFVKACVKTDQVKVLNDFFQRQYSWTSREQGEKMIQLVINELVKSNMSFTQWVEFTADSSNQVRQEIYSELMHYFKPSSMQGQGKRLISKFLPGGNLDDSTRHHSKNYNFLNEKNFFNENSMKQVQLQNLIESITDLPKVGGVINNDDLLAHLLVSLPFIGKLPEPGNIYRLLNDKLEGLFHNDKFISKCERLISNDHFHLLKNSSAKFEKYQNLKSVIDSLKISRGQQVRYRLKLVNAHKIEKIKDMQTVYDLNSFLLSYKKYARNFEVDRTKTMSVSHVSGSLSIGT